MSDIKRIKEIIDIWQNEIKEKVYVIYRTTKQIRFFGNI